MSRHNDARRIADALSKLEGSSDQYDGSPKLAAVTLIRRSVFFETASLLANAADVVAANAGAQRRIMANARVLGVYFHPKGTATANATNNAQIEVVQLQANGVAASVALAAANTAPTANGGTGSLVAGTAVELTVASGANGRVAKGTTIAPKLTQNSSGVALPAGTITVDIELEGAATDYPY
jgi:hypothetical protein